MFDIISGKQYKLLIEFYYIFISLSEEAKSSKLEKNTWIKFFS